MARTSAPAIDDASGADRPAANRPIYLDYQATTPVDPRVMARMRPWFEEAFGNPHSTTHAYGREAAAAVEAARGQVARAVGADPREIVFTSGATEANNLAVIGAARFRGRHEGRRRVIVLATEHKCVVESARALGAEGFEVAFLDVRADGLVDLDRLADAVDERTALVSMMLAHNEIGVIQPVADAARLAHAKGAWLHTDAAQAVGKIPVDVRALDVDLMSVSGHKAYGPKGIGALFVRRRPRIRLEPLFHGGGQERGLRSGTLPAPLCIGMGAALELAAEGLREEAGRIEGLRDDLLGHLRARFPDLLVHGAMAPRLPGNLNLTIPGVDALALIERIPDVAISTGSACTSASVEPSYVLTALGLPPELAAGAVRIAVGRFTTAAEIEAASRRIAEAADGLRRAAAA